MFGVDELSGLRLYGNMAGVRLSWQPRNNGFSSTTSCMSVWYWVHTTQNEELEFDTSFHASYIEAALNPEP